LPRFVTAGSAVDQLQFHWTGLTWQVSLYTAYNQLTGCRLHCVPVFAPYPCYETALSEMTAKHQKHALDKYFFSFDSSPFTSSYPSTITGNFKSCATPTN